MLIREYQIRDEYNLGIFFGDDGTNKDHRVIYLWLETLIDKTPDLSFDEVNNTFKKTYLSLFLIKLCRNFIPLIKLSSHDLVYY